MKFLHLSDLHIGKNLNGFSMIEEQKHVFAQIIGYIKTEHPDAIIIAGDVYDRAIPGVEAVEVFDDFLTECAGEDIAILLISGNHDSPERINFASRLLTQKRIYFYGSFDGKMHKVTLSDKYGNVHFWLLPFIKPIFARGLFDEKEIESYDDLVNEVIGKAAIDYKERNVLLAHQFFTKAGVRPVRSESELTPIGGLDGVDSLIIEGFDYAALGHLHGRQTVGAEHIRYCGSPLKYSFSEWRQEKSVTLAELGKKGTLSVKELPLFPLHDMREIKGEIGELLSNAACLPEREDYVRVILTDEKEIIDPLGKLRSIYPNIMSLDFLNSRTSINLSSVNRDTELMEKLSNFELFRQFFLETQGMVMNEEQEEIVRALLERNNEE